MSARGRARKVQRATDLPYQTCLRLVRGEFVFTPLSDACEVQKALREATKGRYTPPEGVPERACLCLECDGND